MRARLLREWLLVAGMALAFVAALAGLGLATRADDLLYDLAAGLRAPLPSRVTIVAIDDASLAAYGRWPWRRELHARLLRRLAGVRAAAIGYDVLFIEPGAEDAALGRAMASAGGVALPMTFAIPGEDGAPFAPELPVPPLAHDAAIGHALLLPDADGIVRRVSLRAGDARRSWPAFAETIHRRAAHAPSPAFRRTAGGALPAGAFGLSPALLVPTSHGSHPTLSFASVLRGEVPADLLRGRILLVGSTATGSGDRQPVPGGALPGVEVTADIVDALEADRFVRAAGPFAAFLFAAVPLCVLLAALLRLSPRTNLLLGAAALVLLPATSAALLLGADLWLPPAAAVAGILLVHPLWGWRRLSATSAYMLRELGRLQAEPDPLPTSAGTAPPRQSWLDDRIDHQRALLEGSVKRVRDLRRFFADSLQGLPDATLIVDAEDRLLFANDGAARLFGLAEDDASRPALPDLLFACFRDVPVPPPDAATGVELTTEDGRTFMLRRKPFVAPGGKAVGAILSFVDLTALRLVTRQREEALRLLSHDMRAPQAAILALVEAEGDASTRRRIAGYARRTMRLAEEFVLLTRAESAALSLELLNLPALLVEAADELWPVARRKHIRVETPDEVEEQLVSGDRSLLLRTFINLIDNAIRYAPEGSAVRCSMHEEGSFHVCRIADGGPGIPEEALEAIFRPFDRAGRHDQSGTGLGLAFVQIVAARHGGSVAASNDPAGGAVLSVRLPAAYDPPAA